MKTLIILVFLSVFCTLPERSFSITHPTTMSYAQDSLIKHASDRNIGDRIAHWGLKSTTIGLVSFSLAMLLLALFDFEMRGGLLLLLLYGSITIGPILGLLGLTLCIVALLRKDTTHAGRKKARKGLLALLFGVAASIVILTLIFN
jgi:hypothetical protein